MAISTYPALGGTAVKPFPTLLDLDADLIGCRRCPRLVDWREHVAVEKKAAFRDDDYWGRPVPGFGDPEARIAVVGLAPAAHGGNRTGRIFTGDRSGDWLFAALHRAGFANQPTSTAVGDGLHLFGIWVTAAVKCAPPANLPTVEERDMCTHTYLHWELELLSRLQVLVVLGKFAYDAVCRWAEMRRRPAFGHGVETFTPAGMHVICSFHPSQQNTFTKKLTEPMFDTVFHRARELADPTST